MPGALLRSVTTQERLLAGRDTRASPPAGRDARASFRRYDAEAFSACRSRCWSFLLRGARASPRWSRPQGLSSRRPRRDDLSSHPTRRQEPPPAECDTRASFRRTRHRSRLLPLDATPDLPHCAGRNARASFSRRTQRRSLQHHNLRRQRLLRWSLLPPDAMPLEEEEEGAAGVV